MGKVVDLSGKTFGELLVISDTGKRKNQKKLWECLCSCGSTTEVVTGQLTSGKTKSCGCLKSPDLAGQTFGWLTVESKDEGQGRGQSWEARCRCGNTVHVTTRGLRSDGITSCGCKPVGHGMTHTPEYISWRKLRTSNEYPREWDDFVHFFCDVGERPSHLHELTRKDVRKPHGKENTYWRNPNEERAAEYRLTTADLPSECTFDFRTYLRTAAAASEREAAA